MNDKKMVQIKPVCNTCMYKDEIERLIERDRKAALFSVILTPKMIMAICLGLSILIQTFKGM